MSFPRNNRTKAVDINGPQFDDTVQMQHKPKMSFGNLFRDIDLFGHPISLNIGGRSSKHTTICGGLCTVLAIVAMVWHVYY